MSLRGDAGRRPQARPKLRIVSRPRPVQAVALDPERHRGRRRRVTVPAPSADVWAQFPTPLDHRRAVPGAVSEWLLTGHRWFKPQLVHQTLYDADGRFEPALVYVYQTWMDPGQLRRLYGDVHRYIADVSDDVFAIDPDRYVHIRPDQVIQLDNPSGWPVFIHQHAVLGGRRAVVAPATLSVYWDTNVKPSQLKIAMDDAACQLWGYTRAQWDVHHVHDVEDPNVRVKIVPFFFSLFAPSAVYTIIALNLGIFYLHCKFATFRCDIVRRDGKVVPMQCAFTTYLHSKFVHVSQFAFTDVGQYDVDEGDALAANQVQFSRELPDLPLPVLDDTFFLAVNDGAARAPRSP